MQRYREGALEAFDALYARHQAGLYRYLLRTAQGDRERAAEWFQEVWAKLVRGRASYRSGAPFAPWLYGMAQHHVIDHWRKAELPTVRDEEALHAAAAHREQEPDAQLLSRWRLNRLLGALNSLPVEQRNAFLLKEEGGMSLEEIAAATGVGRETAKSRLRYALLRLREALSDVL